jgi:hypothetical protein
MKTDQKLILQLLDESGKRLLLAGIYTDLDFYINGQHCYGFRFGPTDDQGRLCIAFSDVEKQRVLAAKFNLMDYNTPLDKCVGSVKIKIPSADELRKAYEWQTKSLASGASTEAKGWLNAANSKIKCDEVSVELKGMETVVSIQCI